jgi:hypothetical protein
MHLRLWFSGHRLWLLQGHPEVPLLCACTWPMLISICMTVFADQHRMKCKCTTQTLNSRLCCVPGTRKTAVSYLCRADSCKAGQGHVQEDCGSSCLEIDQLGTYAMR